MRVLAVGIEHALDIGPAEKRLVRPIVPGYYGGMDTNVGLRHQFRQTIVMLLAALVTAAAVRHFAHVGGGLSREEIRTWALVGAGALIGVLFAILVFRRQR
jgi:hypothetical protein